jgi:hypothetical protein
MSSQASRRAVAPVASLLDRAVTHSAPSRGTGLWTEPGSPGPTLPLLLAALPTAHDLVAAARSGHRASRHGGASLPAELPIPNPIGGVSVGAAGSSVSGFGILMLAALSAALFLVAPRLGRWLRSVASLSRPLFVSALENPG